MAITLLPTPPSRQDPANFNVRADAFLGALPTFGTEANSLAADVNNKQITASNAAITATTAASTATTKADEAKASAASAEAALDSFDDRYLGAKATDPATDNDGNPLIVGALYFRTTAPIGMKVWTGRAWDDAYANLSSKFDKTGGTISGDTTVQVNSDSAAGLLIENTDTGGINTAAALLFKAGPTVAAQMAMQSLTSTLAIESLNASDIVISTGGSVLRIGAGTGTRVTGGALGYGIGAGGTVVQATSKSAGVTLNKPSGKVSMNSASLAAGASVEFSLVNSFLSDTDGLVVNPSGFSGYSVEVAHFNSPTEVVFRVTNKGATRSDPVVIMFRIFKGALS